MLLINFKCLARFLSLSSSSPNKFKKKLIRIHIINIYCDNPMLRLKSSDVLSNATSIRKILSPRYSHCKSFSSQISALLRMTFLFLSTIQQEYPHHIITNVFICDVIPWWCLSASHCSRFFMTHRRYNVSDERESSIFINIIGIILTTRVELFLISITKKLHFEWNGEYFKF